MKLEIARGLFLAGALSITAMATAAWHQPGMQILETHDCAPCTATVHLHRQQSRPIAEADGNLLLLMFGLSGALKGEQ